MSTGCLAIELQVHWALEFSCVDDGRRPAEMQHGALGYLDITESFVPACQPCRQPLRGGARPE